MRLVDQVRQRPLVVRIWYPAAASATETRVVYARIYAGHAALDADYSEGNLRRPLIVLSHGDRGGNTDQSWLAERLARGGYIVAAVAHWLNTTDNSVPEETVRAWHRPVDVSFVLTALLNDPVWKVRIDSNRVGVAGHSTGGYTALALLGARYNGTQMAAYCQGPLRGPDCDLIKGANIATIDFSDSSELYIDNRVKAAFVMAPALGQAIDKESLAQITTPVHIVYAKDDELLKPNLNAVYYANAIPKAESSALDAGGHFVFLPKCTLLGRLISYAIPFDICGRKAHADRTALHEQVAREAIDFFGNSLNWPPHY